MVLEGDANGEGAMVSKGAWNRMSLLGVSGWLDLAFGGLLLWAMAMSVVYRDPGGFFVFGLLASGALRAALAAFRAAGQRSRPRNDGLVLLCSSAAHFVLAILSMGSGPQPIAIQILSVGIGVLHLRASLQHPPLSESAPRIRNPLG